MQSRRLLRNTLLFALALFWLVIAGMPFLFMFLTGFKAQFELLTRPIFALPEQPTLDNFREVLTNGNFFVYMANSAIVVSVSVTLVLLLSSMAAYVFARIRFRLSGVLFLLVIAGLVIPFHVTLIPVYLLTISVGWYDRLWALLGPYVAFNLPVSIFILTEFMRQIPRELEDAARIDGCGPMRTFWQIILPLSRPGLGTLAIFSAVNLWNEFVFAYVLISSPRYRTLPLAIWEYQGEYGANVPMIMAVLALSAIPLMIAYLIGQESFVKGIMAGAIKG